MADTVKSYGKELGRVDWSMFNPVETSAPDDLIKLVRDGEARIGMAISLLQKVSCRESSKIFEWLNGPLFFSFLISSIWWIVY